MTRTELLAVSKPILFNTEMVRAILDDRKTETRRVVKLKYDNTHIEIHKDKYGKSVIELQNDVEGETFGTNPDGSHWHKLLAYIEKNPPYKKGNILYVRETWTPVYINPKRYLYKTHCSEAENLPIKWHPSIHMPKEAARIFLEVTGVRAERLQDITAKGAISEGEIPFIHNSGSINECATRTSFIGTWNRTIPKKKLDLYGWNANPWVWVVEFEKINITE